MKSFDKRFKKIYSITDKLNDNLEDILDKFKSYSDNKNSDEFSIKYRDTLNDMIDELSSFKSRNKKMQRILDKEDYTLYHLANYLNISDKFFDEMFKHLDKLINMDELNQCSKALASVAFKNTEELLYKLKTKCENNTEFIKESFNNYWNNQ